MTEVKKALVSGNSNNNFNSTWNSNNNNNNSSSSNRPMSSGFGGSGVSYHGITSNGHKLTDLTSVSHPSVLWAALKVERKRVMMYRNSSEQLQVRCAQ
jgi:hypothetical protein